MPLSIRFKRMAPAGRHLVDVIGAGALLYQARTERWVWWSFMFAACCAGVVAMTGPALRRTFPLRAGLFPNGDAHAIEGTRRAGFVTEVAAGGVGDRR
jgi:hypothetical protein